MQILNLERALTGRLAECRPKYVREKVLLPAAEEQ
jgi:hypothetical protein